MGNYISKLKWAWQAQILSHALLIWQKCISFPYIQIMLLGVLASYIGYRFRKITKEFPFQELQCSLYDPIFDGKKRIKTYLVNLNTLSWMVNLLLNFGVKGRRPQNVSLWQIKVSRKGRKRWQSRPNHPYITPIHVCTSLLHNTLKWIWVEIFSKPKT